MTIVDHLLALVLVLLSPAYVAWDARRLAERIAADPVSARTKQYIRHVASGWGITLALIAAWRWAGRPMREIGLGLPDTASAWVWSLLIAAGGIAFFAHQCFSVLKSPHLRAKVREGIASQPGVRTALPSTPREARVFIAVAITAGFCEEVLYRGYVLWYFQSFVPGAVAIAAAVLAFGAGHAYQGVRGILETGAAGAVAMAVYLLTGSLVAPMVLHAAIDLFNGFMIYGALREEAAASER